MTLKVFTDGGSKGNPGPSAIGIVFYVDKQNTYAYREDIGVATNNDAEYTAVIRALEQIINQLKDGKSWSKVDFYSDSLLLVKQVNGHYKVKNGKIREYIFKIRALEQEIGLPISYSHVQRARNSVADALVNGKMTHLTKKD